MNRISYTIIAALILLLSEQTQAAPYVFRWEGTVTNVANFSLDPVSVSGVNIGDWVLAMAVYDPAEFGAGTNIISDGSVLSDGLEYAAPAGLFMTYQFESGAIFQEAITHVRVRDTTTVDQWNWNARGGPNSLLFQSNNPSGTTYTTTTPLPVSFNEAHTLYLDHFLDFDPILREIFVLYLIGDPVDTYRQIIFSHSESSIEWMTTVPEPSTMLLGITVLGIFVIRRFLVV